MMLLLGKELVPSSWMTCSVRVLKCNLLTASMMELDSTIYAEAISMMLNSDVQSVG